MLQKYLFLLQLVRDVTEKEIIGEVMPDTAQVKIPKSVAVQEPSIVLIAGSSDLPTFTTAKE